MKIIEATIHRINKSAQTQGQGSVTVNLREASLTIDDTLKTVCEQLLVLYNKSSDSSGRFGSNAKVHMFPVHLADYHAGQLSFGDFTSAATNLIANQMQGSQFASGGYALFLRYTVQKNDFVLIAMLKLKPGAGIDETTMALLPTLSIDLDLLNEAARVNLTRQVNQQEPYLTFIKGGRNNTKVTAYFRAALDCIDYTHAAEQTKAVIEAARAYVYQRPDLTTAKEKRDEMIESRRRLHQCFTDNADEVNLQVLATAIDPAHPNDFITFSQTVGPNGELVYPISSRFKPDKKVSQGLRRVSGNRGTVRVSFDISDVQAGRVDYDGKHDRLVISNPPDSIRLAILENRDEPSDGSP